MRQMLTEKEVKDIVIKGIQSGEIPAGGMTPQQEAKLNNSLQLPAEAPASDVVVGVNTSGVQNSIGVGDGLVIDSNNLKTLQNTLFLDFNSQNKLVVSEEIKNNLNSYIYDAIIVYNYTSSNYRLMFTNVENTYRAVWIIAADRNIKYLGNRIRATYYEFYINSNNRQASVLTRSFEPYNYYFQYDFVGSSGNPQESGTINNYFNSQYFGSVITNYKVNSSDTYYAPIQWKYIDTANKYAVGFAEFYDNTGTLTATYKIVWSNYSTMNWTATLVS